MRKALLFSLLCATVVLAGACSDGRQRGPVSDLLKPEVLRQADEWLSREPVTVTAFVAERSAGGLHDFYSEGDYWWPDPENPDGPYIRRDGESNPDNFSEHRKAMVDFSRAVGSLTSAYLLTGEQKYAAAAEKQIRAWFIDGETKMNPNLLYAQAIKGRYTGRGIGIIDTLHLIEVAQSLVRLREAGGISQDCLDGAVAWFSEYLRWMSTHEYGLDEMNAKNNHGTCWALQAAAFARLTGDKEVTELCRRRFTEIFLPGQMDPDGSFPQELARTKPYGYSLFNLDAMAALCHILSEDGEDLWEYATEDGQGAGFHASLRTGQGRMAVWTRRDVLGRMAGGAARLPAGMGPVRGCGLFRGLEGAGALPDQRRGPPESAVAESGPLGEAMKKGRGPKPRPSSWTDPGYLTVTVT